MSIEIDHIISHLQAGKLNEEYSSKLKELEEWKHKTQLKMLRAIVILQSVLLILLLVYNIFNEFHVKETSKKIRATWRIKAQRG